MSREPLSVRRRPGRHRASPRFEALESRLTPTTLPPGFTETTVASGLVNPTAMDFAPDGRLFVLEQGGNVELVRNDGTLWTALHLNVDSQGERGLLGIAFDPSFATNHYVYLYYTNPNPGAATWAAGEHNQLSRFTVNGANPQQPVFTNEAPILDWNTLSGATNHNGGAIHFGLDGKLYADAGDNVQTFTQGGQTYRVSQTLNDLLGKQLRINVAAFNTGLATRDDTTVGHLIPSDNPFVGTATGINRLIYALGLRNPFTFAVQPVTGTIFANDVGENTWEEIDRIVPGGNYGWSGGNTDGFGQSPPGPGVYHDPLLAYNHSGGPAGGGIAIVGGSFYNPASAQFPSSYVGKYFYGDLAGGWVRVFDPTHPGSASNPDTSSAFASGIPSGLRDIKVDAAGNLYYLDAGGGGVVEKVSYPAGQPAAPQITTQPASLTVLPGQSATFTVVATGNGLAYQWQHFVGASWVDVGTNAPGLTIGAATAADAGSYRVIVANASGVSISATATLTVTAPLAPPTILMPPTSQQAIAGGRAVLTVSATGSPPLSYLWQHLSGGVWRNVGGGPALVIDPVMTSDAGLYRVVVSDPAGSVTSGTATLTVLQRPTATITAPAPGASYNWGQAVAFSGTGTDPQDGTLAPGRLVWVVFFFREDKPDGTGLRALPVENLGGASGGVFVTNVYDPTPLAWYRIFLTAVDSHGLTGTTFTDVRPNLTRVTLASKPPGLPIALGAGLVASGTTVAAVVGEPLAIGALSPMTLGGTTYVFSAWSDGGAAVHAIVPGAAPVTYTATYTPSATMSFRAASRSPRGPASTRTLRAPNVRVADMSRDRRVIRELADD
jgi:glucose/arabinose dehydrogenase